MSDGLSHVVILIHGTFATSEEIEGAKWWQRGSVFWNWLNQRLAPRAACAGPVEGRLFTWSGKNSEKERLAAGRRLLDRLRAYEREGQPYHLIGHSHGGSVIWAALCEAARRGVALDHLRSWATVGTPFLRYRPKVADAWLLVPFIASAVAFTHISRRIMMELRSVYWSEVWAEEALAAPASLALLWLILLVCLLYCGYRIGLLAAGWWRSVGEARAGLRAFRRYGRQWLGLWTESDEAINLMRVSSKSGPKVAARFIPVPPLAFVIDGGSWDLLQRILQGNDRRGAEVVGAGPGPLPGVAFPALPTEDGAEGPSGRLAADAPGAVLGLRGTLRTLARDDSEWSRLKATIQEQGLSWNTLMLHTTYFPEDGKAGADPGPISELLALHIEQAMGCAIDETSREGRLLARLREARGRDLFSPPVPSREAESPSPAVGPDATTAPAGRATRWAQPRGRRPAVLQATSLAVGLAALGLSGVAWLGGVTSIDQFRVYTPKYQVDRALDGIPFGESVGRGHSESAHAWVRALTRWGVRAEGGRLDKALKAIDRIDSNVLRLSCLQEVAVELAGLHRDQDALVVADQFPDVVGDGPGGSFEAGSRSWVIREIAREHARQGRAEAARDAAFQIKAVRGPDLQKRAQNQREMVLADAVRTLVRDIARQHARRVRVEAVRDAPFQIFTVGAPENQREMVLADAVRILASSHRGNVEGVTLLAEAIDEREVELGDRNNRASVLSDAALEFAKQGRAKEAGETAMRINDAKEKTEAYVGAVRVLSGLKLLDEAFELARAGDGSDPREPYIRDMASLTSFIKSGRTQDVMGIAAKMPVGMERSELHELIADIAAKHGQVKEALAAAEQLGDFRRWCTKEAGDRTARSPVVQPRDQAAIRSLCGIP